MIKNYFISPSNNIESILLSRTACLGNNIIQKMRLKEFSIKNHQKSRIDYILKCSADKNYTVKVDHIKQYIPRQDVREVIEQSTNDFFGYNNVKIIIIDSFAELVDKLFLAKEGWAFCTYYSDIDHTGDFDINFQCEGLIPIDQLKNYYTKFFDKLKSVYGEIPIIFLHFPTTFEKREEYKRRYGFIKDVITQLSNQYQNLHSIIIDEEIVTPHESDDHPYHFSDKTIEAFLNKILDLNINILKNELNLTSKKKISKIKSFRHFIKEKIKNFIKCK